MAELSLVFRSGFAASAPSKRTAHMQLEAGGSAASALSRRAAYWQVQTHMREHIVSHMQ